MSQSKISVVVFMALVVLICCSFSSGNHSFGPQLSERGRRFSTSYVGLSLVSKSSTFCHWYHFLIYNAFYQVAVLMFDTLLYLQKMKEILSPVYCMGS